LETESLGLLFKPELGPKALTLFFSGKNGLVVRLVSLQEVVDDASQLVGRDADGSDRTMFGALVTVELSQMGLATIEGLSSHAQGVG
jgi:hypothetical protein